MATSSSCNKKEFIQWLKNYNGQLKTIGEHTRHRLVSIREKNDVLSTKIQDSYPQSSQSLLPMNSAFKVTQQMAQTTMHACDQHVKIQLEKIRKGNETIETRMKEEAMRSREALYKILNKDEVALKPYHEVETLTEKLKQEIDCIYKEVEATKQKSFHVRDNMKREYTEISQDIDNLETLNKELGLEISNMRSYLSDRLFALNLKSGDSIDIDSPEIKELSNELSDLEAKLNAYSKYL